MRGPNIGTPAYEGLLISIAAVLSGADSWKDIAACGRSKPDWFCVSLKPPGGIPSRDNQSVSSAPEIGRNGTGLRRPGLIDCQSDTAVDVVAKDRETSSGTSEAGRRSWWARYRPGTGTTARCYERVRSLKK